MTYTLIQHKHNFSIWAAARAAQRGFTNVTLLKEALEQCRVTFFAENPRSIETSEAFDTSHKEWCLSICDYLEEKGVQNVTYGRAAKLIAVYLKSMIVMSDPDSKQAHFIHPPIDRILLKNVADQAGLDNSVKIVLKEASWTRFDEKKYFYIFGILRELVSGEAMWKIEKYWEITNN